MGQEYIIMEQTTKPLFVGNLAPYVKPKHLTELFEEKGTVAKIGELQFTPQSFLLLILFQI